MKTNHLLKILYIFILLLGMHSAYSDSLSFDFLYADDKIQNVTFFESEYDDYATDIDKTASFNISTSDLGNGYRVTVNADITHTGSPTVAGEFNWIDVYLPNYNNSYVMELAGAEPKASSLDFWVMGALYINGKLVDTGFTLAHNNHSNSIGANDWWVTTSLTNTTARYESGNLVKLNLQDVEGTPYCLSQNNTNYQVVVSSGACSSNAITTENTTSTNKSLQFEYESGINSVEFVYDGKYGDTDSLPAVGSNLAKYGYEVTVASKLDANSATADSFNDKFESGSYSELHITSSTTSLSTPGKLNFWVEGKLYINGNLVASDFTLGQNGDWWIGTNSGHSFKDSKDGYVKMYLNNDQYCLVPLDSSSVKIFQGACPTISNGSGRGPV